MLPESHPQPVPQALDGLLVNLQGREERLYPFPVFVFMVVIPVENCGKLKRISTHWMWGYVTHTKLDYTLKFGYDFSKVKLEISAPDFAERYRVAAHYIALSYMFWTLEAWQEDRSMGMWVRHYLDQLLV